MKVIVVGLGVQGKKRRQFAGDDYVAAVDPVNSEADYADISKVPLTDYDAALVCLPDKPKYQVIKYLISHGKHVLVEKPLWTPKRADLFELQTLAQQNKVVLYTAYNHRFEPHIQHIYEKLQANLLGEVYRCRLFYGNGTARLARNSVWRDTGSGVLADLCCHLLDFIDYWFNERDNNYVCIDVARHENKAPDHVVIFNHTSKIKIEFEMSLLSWRNSFYCDIIGEKGSLRMESLCKWGPSQLIHRQRILPSGRPPEASSTLVQSDPTWALEYTYFKTLVQKHKILNLEKDIWIYDQLNQLTAFATQKEVGVCAA
ncbi:MAG: Gfo/Idh/MocA family oxidoreductase [Gammaproteobacteria bacterium]|nr:Gfo/Idh/MocA family oxidoreductase [Gammaproteobacteria bacterium]